MAGETTKSTDLTTAQSGKGEKIDARKAKGRTVIVPGTAAFTATDTETADVKLFNIKFPTNAIVDRVEIYNDDLDSHATPTLAIDVGYFAAAKMVTVTGGTKTVNAQNAVLDADALVDGATDAQAATTKWTQLALDSATMGPDDVNKAIWEVLGYDKDPGGEVIIGVTSATAAATGAAGDMAIRVTARVPE